MNRILVLLLCTVAFNGGQVAGQGHGGDYSAIPGMPDVNYPILSEISQTSFRCEQQQWPGYYADVEARCQVFHICANNMKYDFLCPNGTIFHQQHLVCVWWNQFDCNRAPSLFFVNQKIFESSISESDVIAKGNLAGGQMTSYGPNTGSGALSQGNFPGSSGFNSGYSGYNGGSSNPITGSGVLSQGNFAGSAGYSAGYNGGSSNPITGSGVLSQGNFAGSAGYSSGYNGGSSNPITGSGVLSQGNFAGSTGYSSGYNGGSSNSITGSDVLSQGNSVGSGLNQGLSGQGGQGGSSHTDGSYPGGDHSAIPGQPGVDYPNFSQIFKTSFSCKDQQWPGYYADVEARCQIFHVCSNNITYDFLCPNGTIFNQEYFVCVWWNQFDCSTAPNFFALNENLYKSPNSQSNFAGMTQSDTPSGTFSGNGVLSQGNQPGSAGLNMGFTGSNVLSQGNQPGSAGLNMGFTGSNFLSQGSQPGSAGLNMGFTGSNVLSQGSQPGSAGLNTGLTGSNVLSQGNQPGSAGLNTGTGSGHGSTSFPDDGSYPGGDYSAIPGEPGVDYPILSEIPQTSFKCEDQQWPGYYGDVETKCQVFHICANNQKYDFLCPNGTIFDQEYFVCVWWNQFDCSTSPNFFALNEKIYSSPMTGSGVLSQGNSPGSIGQGSGFIAAGGSGMNPNREYLPPSVGSNGQAGSNVLSQGNMQGTMGSGLIGSPMDGSSQPMLPGSSPVPEMMKPAETVNGAQMGTNAQENLQGSTMVSPGMMVAPMMPDQPMGTTMMSPDSMVTPMMMNTDQPMNAMGSTMMGASMMNTDQPMNMETTMMSSMGETMTMNPEEPTNMETTMMGTPMDMSSEKPMLPESSTVPEMMKPDETGSNVLAQGNMEGSTMVSPGLMAGSMAIPKPDRGYLPPIEGTNEAMMGSDVLSQGSLPGMMGMSPGLGMDGSSEKPDMMKPDEMATSMGSDVLSQGNMAGSMMMTPALMGTVSSSTSPGNSMANIAKPDRGYLPPVGETPVSGPY